MRKPAVEDIQLPLGLHREAVDRVLELLWRVCIEMSEAAAQVGRRTHLPEQPVEGFGAPCGIGGQEFAEFLRQVEQDRTRLEDADRRLHAAVQQRRDLRVRVDLDKTAGELFTLADADQPGVVLGTDMPKRQQLLEHDGHLHAIGRGQRIQLQRMLAGRQRLVMGRAGNRAVDVGELATRRRVVFPDLGRNIRRFAHVMDPIVRLW
ncbi:hypothetical protein D9M71_581540 [compost metagenome]